MTVPTHIFTRPKLNFTHTQGNPRVYYTNPEKLKIREKMGKWGKI